MEPGAENIQLCFSGSVTIFPSAECDRPRSQHYRKESGAAAPEDGRTPEIVKQPDEHASTIPRFLDSLFIAAVQRGNESGFAESSPDFSHSS